jgi:cytochrome c5
MLRQIAIRLALTAALGTMAVAQTLPQGEGKKLLEERCVSCHSLEPVLGLHQTEEAWKRVVTQMVGYGAQLNGKEIDIAAGYLASHFGPKSAAAAASMDTAEEKIAKRYLQGICSSCHEAGVILSKRATKQEWLDIVTRMNGLDAGVSQRDVEVLVNYLAGKYGRK